MASSTRHKYPDGIERVRVTNAFLGLYGSASPMPPYFVEKIALDDYQGGPQPVREFLDVFHHRLLALLYRTWTKYRFAVMYRRKGADPFTRRMFCAVGIDGMKDAETTLNRFLHLRYAPLLASKSRSVRGLQVVLDDMFGHMGVKIEQFIGHWTLIEKPNRNKLGVMNHQLGESMTLGRYVYDGTGRFNVVLGPLSYDDYLSFLPGGHRRPLLRSVVATFTRGQQDVILELHVKTDEAPRFTLGSPRAADAQADGVAGRARRPAVQNLGPARGQGRRRLGGGGRRGPRRAPAGPARGVLSAASPLRGRARPQYTVMLFSTSFTSSSIASTFSPWITCTSISRWSPRMSTSCA